jgi:hypothetical protein
MPHHPIQPSIYLADKLPPQPLSDSVLTVQPRKIGQSDTPLLLAASAASWKRRAQKGIGQLVKGPHDHHSISEIDINFERFTEIGQY